MCWSEIGRERLLTGARDREHLRTSASIVEHPVSADRGGGKGWRGGAGVEGGEGDEGRGETTTGAVALLYTPLKSHTLTLNLPTLNSGGSWVGYGKA